MSGAATSITGVLKDMLDRRAARGLATYGRPLEAFNGREALLDALEEVLDLAAYIQQEREERKRLEAELERAMAVVNGVRAHFDGPGGPPRMDDLPRLVGEVVAASGGACDSAHEFCKCGEWADEGDREGVA